MGAKNERVRVPCVLGGQTGPGGRLLLVQCTLNRRRRQRKGRVGPPEAPSRRVARLLHGDSQGLPDDLLDAVAETFKALSDPTRAQVVFLLTKREYSVNELSEAESATA